MITVTLDPATEHRLAELARGRGTSQSDLARELIEASLAACHRYAAPRPEPPSARTMCFDPRAIRDLNKLARPVHAEITTYLKSCIVPAESPRDFGKPLRHAKFGLWRYRLRDCQENLPSYNRRANSYQPKVSSSFLKKRTKKLLSV